jgi:hypothetical protein
MAFTDTTTFYGKDLQGFYSTLLLTGNTKSVVKFFPNVKSKIKIAKLDVDGILQADSCSFNSYGDTTLGQKTLEVCPLKVNLEYCVTSFEANYLSEQLRAGSNTGEVMPASTEEYLIGQIAKNVSSELEVLIWQGNSGLTSSTGLELCDGFLVQLAADLTVATVSGTTVSSSNVIAELAKVYAAIPATVIDSPDLVIFAPPSIVAFYKQAMAALGFFATYNTGNYDLNYLGIPIVSTAGLPANKMVAADKNNLWFASDLMSDFEDIIVIPQYKISGSPTVRLVVRFKFGTNFGVGAEIVYYR